MQKYADLLDMLKSKTPLVHQITNYVTVNDCANVTICIGASPVMSHAVEDVRDMIAIADALVLNIGTLDESQIKGMLEAGKAASKKGIPIILDPVGAGATPYRTQTAALLLKELNISIIKGNAGEIGTLAGVDALVRGVDSQKLSGDPVETVKSLALASSCVVVMSGADDIVSDGKRVAVISNGVPLMGKISGSGCMASAICGAFAAVSDFFEGCVAAMAVLGVAGELAAEKSAGPGSFKPAFLDAVYVVDSGTVLKKAKIKEY
ncbi:MAG: hydroxyethylthiazole kinase [Leptospirales bacterium]|nr:hydroxyethylthiazole kinase [Leptospirales bacterium]